MAGTAATQNNDLNVSTVKGVAGGYMWVAPHGTSLPTSATGKLNDEFKNVGYINDEGVTHTRSATESVYRDMNGDVIDSSTGEITRTVKQKLAEINEVSLAEFYGPDNVSVNDGVIHVKDTNAEMPMRSVVYDLVLKNGRRMRKVEPKVRASNWGDIQDVSTALGVLDLTYTKFKGDTGTYEDIYIESAEGGDEQ